MVTGCFDIGYTATDDVVWVVSLGFTGRRVVNVFTTTEEVGIGFSVVCAIEGSLVPLTVAVFSVLKALTAVINSVEYLGVIVGGMTVRVCNGADTLGCVELADVLKSNARDLVKVSAVRVSVSVLAVEISGGVVVLTVEVFENVTGSVLVVSGGTLRVSDVVSVVSSEVNVSIEGRVLILVSNLAEVGDMSMLGAIEEFVLMDSDGVTVGL